MEARLTKVRTDNKGKDKEKEINYETKQERMERGEKNEKERADSHESRR